MKVSLVINRFAVVGCRLSLVASNKKNLSGDYHC